MALEIKGLSAVPQETGTAKMEARWNLAARTFTFH